MLQEIELFRQDIQLIRNLYWGQKTKGCRQKIYRTTHKIVVDRILKKVNLNEMPVPNNNNLRERMQSR